MVAGVTPFTEPSCSTSPNRAWAAAQRTFIAAGLAVIAVDLGGGETPVNAQGFVRTGDDGFCQFLTDESSQNPSRQIVGMYELARHF
jgi:hypothetical protein